MATGQTERREIVKPHIAPGEELRAAATGRGKVTAVTDRRVLSITQTEAGTEQQREVESVLLTSNRVVGTSYGKTDRENRGTLQRAIGVILALLGGLSLLFGIQADGEIQMLVFLFALLALAVGIVLYLGAEDTKEGSVSITVRRAGDVPDRTWAFPRGETEVPLAISEEVARIHGGDSDR